ncbi:MAG: helix-turn-helix domain-containing protein [Candidatus Colwellbacteria bacterium]|nr:helix-turn-helix domain-containing protein [Candidatus Colwellbacteria bacterium]
MNPNINKNDLGEVLEELMQAHGTDDEKLAQITEIPLRFIKALKTGDYKILPASPYVRGYIKKIAIALKTDPAELIAIYKSTAQMKKSGSQDLLPSNRFASVPLRRGVIIFIIVALAAALIIVLRFNQVFGLPTLNVEVPGTTALSTLEISGSINPKDKLTINEEAIYTDENGVFNKLVFLEPGLNILEFKVKRFLGKEKTVVKQVYYEPSVENTTIPQLDNSLF